MLPASLDEYDKKKIKIKKKIVKKKNLKFPSNNFNSPQTPPPSWNPGST